MLTSNKLKEFKQDYPVYRGVSVLDEYNNEELEYKQIFILKNIMFSPVEDAFTIELYGKKEAELYVGVYYGNEDVREQDHVYIDKDVYEVVSVLKYKTHKQITIRKIKNV
jgi:hypothetical protein